MGSDPEFPPLYPCTACPRSWHFRAGLLLSLLLLVLWCGRRRSGADFNGDLGEECGLRRRRFHGLWTELSVLSCSASCSGGGLRGRESRLRMIDVVLTPFKRGRAKLCKGCKFTGAGFVAWNCLWWWWTVASGRVDGRRKEVIVTCA